MKEAHEHLANRPKLDNTILAHLSKPRVPFALALAAINAAIYISISLANLRLNSLWASTIAWPIQALILCGVYNMMHDCVHGSFFAKRRPNIILGSLLGAVVLLNFRAYKCFHLMHHSDTLKAKDKEHQVKLARLSDYLRYIPLFGFFWSFAKVPIFALRGAFPTYVTNKSARRGVVIDSVAQLAWSTLIFFCCLGYPRLTLMLYIGPLLVFFPMTGFTGLPEHYGTDVDSSTRVNTRSIESNRLFQLFFWFNNYHAEHHSFPSVPAYNLRRVHTLIRRELKYTERSYLRFHLRLLGELCKRRAP